MRNDGNKMLKDADIREPLFDFLEEKYGKIRIIEEKNIGRSRADVLMVIDGALIGLEIKSDADTYTRLAGQVKDYDKFYDYNYAVVGTKHANTVNSHVPAYWGIITVDEIIGKADFYVLRKPKLNPKCKIRNKLSLLWRPELAQLQELNKMPKYKQQSKDYVIAKIIERTEYKSDQKGYIALDILNNQISDLLFERDYNNIEEQLTEYRKGELQKKIEVEDDPMKRFQLMLEQEKKKQQFEDRGLNKKKKRHRRYVP